MNGEALMMMATSTPSPQAAAPTTKRKWSHNNKTMGWDILTPTPTTRGQTTTTMGPGDKTNDKEEDGDSRRQ
jgi:hypothetical protein